MKTLKRGVTEKTKTLITFLGRGRDDPTKGYRTTTYRFPGGHTDVRAYFGIALATWLKVDRIVLLGTNSSMWDVLIENLAVEGEEEALRLELIDAVQSGRVDDALLERLAPIAERAVERPCELHVIPHARKTEEQIQILERLAALVSNKESIFIDLTHGYRHLGMLGFAAAGFLRATRNVKIEGLYYGALDMTENGETPVIELDGLYHLHAWTEALARFDASGNYGVFASLLEDEGLPKDKAQCLSDAAFHETATQVFPAAQKLQTVLQALAQPLHGVSELFRDKLHERLSWAQNQNLAEQQHTLALRALERGDFLRACIFGLEAFITRCCLERNLDPRNYEKREQVAEAIQDEFRNEQHPDRLRRAYWTTRHLRNAMAHGTLPKDKRLRDLLANPERLEEELETQIKLLNSH